MLSLPQNPDFGDYTFFEDQGEWHLVKEKSDGAGSKFPADTKRSITDAETATADALGKLTLK